MTPSMKPRKYALAVCALGLALSAKPAPAHHSFAAEFDSEKCMDFTGTFASYDWENPHAYFNLDVKDHSGAVTTWNFETVSPAWMKRSGTERRDFVSTVGKTVKVRGCLAKNGANRAAAETVTTPDGRILRVGNDYEHGESSN